MSLEHRWQSALDHLRAAGRYRRLTPPCGVDFSSNDYLGYAPLSGERTFSPRLRTRERGAGGEGVDPAATPTPSEARSGCASRLLRGHHAIWDEVESELAAWHGADAALIFTSGYVANEGLLATLIEPEDWVASDEGNHASIIDGLRLSRADKFVYRHNDLDHLEHGLRDVPRAGQRFIITESLFGMAGDRAPLIEIVELAERHGARLIVDEAHATGCFGPRGSGLVDQLGLRQRVLATMHTGGKALGVMGGYVCGSRLLRDYLVNRCRHLIFTTALAPIVGTWWLDALQRALSDESGRARLHDNAACFRRTLHGAGVESPGDDYIVPIVLGDDGRAVAAASSLQAAGFDVRAIRPPTVPVGTARLRISIHADHTPEQLSELAGLLKSCENGTLRD